MRSIIIAGVFVIFLQVSPVSSTWTWSDPIPQGNALFGVWVDSSDVFFAVGANGTIVRFDHADYTCWTESTGMIRDLWGSSPDNVIAVGEGGTILRFDGCAWSTMISGTEQDLNGVWGATAESVYAVGDQGTILHYDGTSWNQQAMVTSENLSAIWGRSATEIYAAGGLSVVKYDGIGWTNNPVPRDVSPATIWASGPEDVYVGGHGFNLLHFDGVQWSLIDIPDRNVRGLSGRSANDIDAVCWLGNVLHWNGMEWSSSGKSTPCIIWNGQSTSDGGWIGVGEGGGIFRYEGDQWTALTRSAMDYNPISEIFAVSENVAFAIGHNGAMARWNGVEWSKFEVPVENVITGIWASDSSDIWITLFPSGNGELILHWDGQSWSDRTPDIASGESDIFSDIWGFSSSEVYCVNGNNLYRWDGSNWQHFDVTSSGFCRLWGNSSTGLYSLNNVYQGGSKPIYYATLSHWNNGDFELLLVHQGTHFHGIWGTSPNDITIAEDRCLNHWDGTNWTQQPVPYLPQIMDVAIGFEDQVFCFAGSVLSYWDGQIWRKIDLPSAAPSLNVTGTSPDNLLSAGDVGMILQGDSKTSLLGVEIQMPEFIESGQPFYVNGFLHNSQDQTLQADVYFILDVFGAFFFWDDWTCYAPPDNMSIDFVPMSVPPGVTSIAVIPELVWPGGEDEEVHGLYFYGGMLDPVAQQLIGEIDSVEFGYSMAQDEFSYSTGQKISD